MWKAFLFLAVAPRTSSGVKATNTVPVPMRFGIYNYTIFIGHPLDWTRAKANCETMGGLLATLKDEKAITELSKMLQYLQVWKAWTGLHRSSSYQSWEWLDGQGKSIHWASGQPRDDEACAMLQPSMGKGFRGKRCNEKLNGYICHQSKNGNPVPHILHGYFSTSTHKPFLCESNNTFRGEYIGIAVGVGIGAAILLTSAALFVVKRKRRTEATQVPTFTYHSYLDQRTVGDSMSDAEQTFTENGSLYDDGVAMRANSIYESHAQDAHNKDDVTTRTNSICKGAPAPQHEYMALDIQTMCDPGQGICPTVSGACHHSSNPQTSRAKRNDTHVYTELQLQDNGSDGIAKENTRHPAPTGRP